MKKCPKDRPSSLSIFYGNVTYLGKTVIDYVSRRQDHIIGVVETHLRGAKAESASDKIQAAGWVVSQAPARVSTKSASGTHGGALLMHKPWLQTAIPAEAEGPGGKWLPENDIAWKHVRIKGLSIVIAFAYFDVGTGLKGSNMVKVHRLQALRDGGRAHLIVLGDFNVSANEWHESGFLDILNCTVQTAGEEGTCKSASGYSLIDYALIDNDILNLVESLVQVGEVPWKPHVGLRLKLNRRPEHVYTKQLIKPKPLPMKKDEKGEFEKWSINDDDWNRLLRDHHDEATSYIKDQCTEDNPAYKHSVLLHIDNKSKCLAERYAAWSLAAEHAMIQANGSDKDREHMSRGKSDMTGRGRMPEYALKSLATKSSDKGIEHCMWQFDSKSKWRVQTFSQHCGPPLPALLTTSLTHASMTTNTTTQITVTSSTLTCGIASNCISAFSTTSVPPRKAL